MKAGPASGASGTDRQPDKDSEKQAAAKAPSAGEASPGRPGLASPAARPGASDESGARNGESRAANSGRDVESPAGSSGSKAAAGKSVSSAGETSPAKAAADEGDKGEKGDKARGDASTPTVRVVPGIARYHRSDCILIRFLADEDLEIMSRDAAAAGGCVPCKACQPDQSVASVPVA